MRKTELLLILIKHLLSDRALYSLVLYVTNIFSLQFWWRFGLVVHRSIVGRVNEVTLRRAVLVLRLVTVCGFTVLVLNQATQANSTFHPSGAGKSNIGLLGWGEGGARLSVSGGR